jgi:hypothetical protein
VKTCIACSKEIPDSSAHCGFCGVRQPGDAPRQASYGLPALRGQPPPSTRPPTMTPAAAPVLVAPAEPIPAHLVPAASGPVTAMPPAAQTPPVAAAPIPAPTPSATYTTPPRPQYLASQSDRRGLAPVEPWSGTLRGLCVVLGVMVLGTFFAPWSVPEGGSPVFSWTVMGLAEGFGRVWPAVIAAAGFLAVLSGILPLPTSARGVIAALAGAGPLIVAVFSPGQAWGGLIDASGWRGIALMAGLLLTPVGLLLRSRYTASLLARLLASLGAAAILATVLVPGAGSVPLVGHIRAMGELGEPLAIAGEGWWIVVALLAALAFLVWMPRSTHAGERIYAWLLMLWLPALYGFLGLGPVVAGGAELLARTPYFAYLLVDLAVFVVLASYGLATVIGKGLEDA